MKYFEAGLLIWLAIRLWLDSYSVQSEDQSDATTEEEVNNPHQDDANT